MVGGGSGAKGEHLGSIHYFTSSGPSWSALEPDRLRTDSRCEVKTTSPVVGVTTPHPPPADSSPPPGPLPPAAPPHPALRLALPTPSPAPGGGREREPHDALPNLT